MNWEFLGAIFKYCDRKSLVFAKSLEIFLHFAKSQVRTEKLLRSQNWFVLNCHFSKNLSKWKLDVNFTFVVYFQDSKVGIRCSSKGLKVAETSSFSSEVSLNVASEVKPFQSASIKMYVRADLTQLAKDNSSLEHRVMKKSKCAGEKTIMFLIFSW